MPNSLNKIFRHFREKQKQRNLNKDNQKDIFQDEFGNWHSQIVVINNSNKGGLGGCCSRKTSSSIPSGDQHNLTQKKQIWVGRKNSDQLFYLLNSEQFFTNALLCRIFDSVESPFDLIRLRRVCKKATEYVKNRISHVTELDVRRVKFETLSASSIASSCSLSSSCGADTSAIVEGELWHTHPSGCKVLGRITTILEEKEEENKENLKEEKEEKSKNISKFRLEVLVDEHWTSREIGVLCSLIGEFRIDLNRISLDAPIFELIVAKLASIDLDRWFAYQCFVKAVDECQMNAALNKLAAQLQQQDDPYDKTDNLYWPNAKTIIIRTTENESIHLARQVFRK
uniref:F-box domain-containing protein n=1 Tax=Meloidogyne hapla TaxID=6305 RepID=A0A1I8BUU8_MELHA